MSLMSCSLCEVSTGSAGEVLFRNDFATVLVSDDWAVAGHLVVVAASHVENSGELPPAEFYGFFDVFRAAERALLSVLEVERVMVMKLGIAVPHLHHHLYPFSAAATREEVFAAIDAKQCVDLPAADRERLVERIRRAIEAEIR